MFAFCTFIHGTLIIHFLWYVFQTFFAKFYSNDKEEYPMESEIVDRLAQALLVWLLSDERH